MAGKRSHADAFSGPADDIAFPTRLPTATKEIVTYFEELKTHFDSLDDKEEQSLLVANALEEASGQEGAVITDPTCSRILETLLPAAETQQLIQFFEAVLSGQGLLHIASSPFGSHVIEALLAQLTLPALSQQAAADADPASQLLTEACNSICEHLYDFITNRYATHVARRLLCIVAGRNVLPLAAKSQNKKQAGGALASKVGLLPGKQTANQGTAYPEQLHAIVDTLLSTDYVGSLHGLMYEQNASPFLQGTLTACEGNGEALQALIPAILGAQPGAEEEGDDSLLQGISRGTFQGIMQDRLSSHVMEVIFSVAPQPLLEEFYSSFLSGDLPALASHPSANFALQAFLAAANRSPLVKALLAELKGSFKELLQRRRSGVVAAMLAACARTSVGQDDASKALAAALTALHEEGKGVAETLLTLDMPGRITGPDVKPGQRVKLSPLGCAILSTLLSFPQFSQAFVASIGDWSPSETLRVGQDPGGSRVLEALVNASTTSKAKKKLLRKLKGMWGILAVEPGGSHVVEACFAWGGVKDKEVIAEELGAAEGALSATPRGSALMRKCGMSGFKSSSSDWKRKAAADAHTLSEYTALFGSDKAAATGAVAAADQTAGDQAVSAPEPDAAVATAVAGHMPSGEADTRGSEDEARAPKKRKKGKAAATAEDGVTDKTAEELAQPKTGKKSKKAKKLSKQQEQQSDDGLGLLEVLEDIPSKPFNGKVGDVASTQAGKKKTRKKNHATDGLPEVHADNQDKATDSKAVGSMSALLEEKNKAAINKAAKAKDAKAAVGTQEAMALLGFAAGKPPVKQKKKPEQA